MFRKNSIREKDPPAVLARLLGVICWTGRNVKDLGNIHLPIVGKCGGATADSVLFLSLTVQKFQFQPVKTKCRLKMLHH